MSNYLPILGELFESDSLSFLLVGLAIGLILGINSNNIKVCFKHIIVFSIIYGLCEYLTQIVSGVNYLYELLLLFVGTFSIGGSIGYLVSLIIIKIKISKNG